MTCAPDSAAATAADMPAGPPPTTTTSARMRVTRILLALDLHTHTHWLQTCAQVDDAVDRHEAVEADADAAKEAARLARARRRMQRMVAARPQHREYRFTLEGLHFFAVDIDRHGQAAPDTGCAQVPACSLRCHRMSLAPPPLLRSKRSAPAGRVKYRARFFHR